MNNSLFIVFIIANAANVIIQTIKSIATIRCSKMVAALVNAFAYGLYTYILVLMNCELPLFQKMLIVAGCNFVGVYVVKHFEEKARKDRIWEIKATFPSGNKNWYDYIDALRSKNIPCNWVNAGKYIITHAYAETQEQTATIHSILKPHGVKYFISETKNF